MELYDIYMLYSNLEFLLWVTRQTRRYTYGQILSLLLNIKENSYKSDYWQKIWKKLIKKNCYNNILQPPTDQLHGPFDLIITFLQRRTVRSRTVQHSTEYRLSIIRKYIPTLFSPASALHSLIIWLCKDSGEQAECYLCLPTCCHFLVCFIWSSVQSFLMEHTTVTSVVIHLHSSRT